MTKIATKDQKTNYFLSCFIGLLAIYYHYCICEHITNSLALFRQNKNCVYRPKNGPKYIS
ncbi:MAG: hypothetical protein ACI808_002802 [Paraglaciecola sp.]